nr:hypothetical protein CFP56_71277 [Quercus suber]
MTHDDDLGSFCSVTLLSHSRIGPLLYRSTYFYHWSFKGSTNAKTGRSRINICLGRLVVHQSGDRPSPGTNAPELKRPRPRVSPSTYAKSLKREKTSTRRTGPVRLDVRALLNCPLTCCRSMRHALLRRNAQTWETWGDSQLVLWRGRAVRSGRPPVDAGQAVYLVEWKGQAPFRHNFALSFANMALVCGELRKILTIS